MKLHHISTRTTPAGEPGSVTTGGRALEIYELNPTIPELCAHYQYHDSRLVRELIELIEDMYDEHKHL